jgi:hypothetical protein
VVVLIFLQLKFKELRGRKTLPKVAPLFLKIKRAANYLVTIKNNLFFRK